MRFVVEQGFATIEQLWKVAWSDQKNSSYTYNRVLSLEKFGFLKSVKINDTTMKIVTSTPKARIITAESSAYPTPVQGVSKHVWRMGLDAASPERFLHR